MQNISRIIRLILGMLMMLIFVQQAFASEFKGSEILDKHLGIPLKIQATNGQTIQIPDPQGKVVVLLFGYTHCPDVCPTHLLTYANVMKELGEQAKRVQLYFVTVDSKRDTPKVLQGFVSTFYPTFLGISPTSKQLATIQQAWQVTSHIEKSKSPNYFVQHSTGVFLINPQGQTQVYEPFGQDTDDIVHDIKVLLSQQDK